ncbi:MAG: M20/M25/M40 family metallo-hydrolase [Acidobacteriaceae bacterium]|nr:M20/M25/M40 family metallo-hydrolase [Acidobacteriaceae bacterium]
MLLTAATTAGVLAGELTSPEQQALLTIDATTAEAEALLETLVNINSGTLNIAGVRQIADILRPQFEALGFTVRWNSMDQVQRAGTLIAERQGTHGRKVLLIGHMDTVFEPASPFQKFVRKGNIAEGPGTSDMKGGLVIMLYALKALNATGALDGANISVVLTGDEERPGDPLSVARRDLIEAGKRNQVALEFEGGSRNESGREFATIARRSASMWTLRVQGEEGHSSAIFSDRMGSGAIFEMSRILDAFQSKLKEPDLTFNVGLVLGGSRVDYDEANVNGKAAGKSNIIPPVAIAHGDIRTISDEQLQRVREKMRQIVNEHLPRTKAEITFVDEYPSMPPTEGNRAILKVLNGVNRDLNLESMEALPPSKRGAGDISFVAPYLDGLSGLGAVGAGAHAPGETVDLTRQPIQTKRAALLIYRLTR